LESSGESGEFTSVKKPKIIWNVQGGCKPRGEAELKNKGSWSTFFLDGLN